MKWSARAVGVLVLPTAALATVLAAPAQAVAPFGAAHRVLPDSCVGTMTVLDSSGYRHGFTVCQPANGNPAMYAVTAAPGATTWSRSKVASNVADLGAVADDGSTSYALYEGDNGGISLLTHSTSGATHTRLVSKTDRFTDGGASLVARDGKWWAVWSEATNETGATICDYLFQAKTLGGTEKAHNTKLCAREPSLALEANGSAVLAYRANDYDYGGGIFLTAWNGHKWPTGHEFNKKVAAGLRPEVVTSGGVTRVSWLQADNKTRGDDVDLASKSGSGAWHIKRLTTTANGWNYLGQPYLALSDGRAFVAWTVVDAATERQAKTVVEELSGGKWTHRTVGSGKAGATTLIGLDAHAGKASLLFEHDGTTQYDELSRQ